MKKIFTTMALSLLVALQAIAQYQVHFQVKDSIGEGEPFATVRIFKANNLNKVVSTGVTTIDGEFDQQIATEGSYRLSISAVGKNTLEKEFTVGNANKVANLGTLIIGANNNVLAGVTVTGKAPVVKNEIDRLTYNVQNDEESKTRTAFDMLRKVPLVSIDGQEKILVKGSGGYKIYKNGHPDPSISQNPKEVLKSIPASMIKRIEVITEPGAKYDAEGVGAILNIVTMESSAISGVTGTVVARVNNYGAAYANAHMTTQIGKVVTSVNYGHVFLNKHLQKNILDEQMTYANGNELTTHTVTLPKVSVNHGNIESSWEPDTLNLLSLSFGGYWYDASAKQTGTNTMMNGKDLLFSYTQHINAPKWNSFSFNGRFDYEHKTHHKGEALTLSYMLSTSRDHQDSESNYEDLVNFPAPYMGIGSFSISRFLEQTVQFDWTRPFAKYHKFETGLKYINRRNTSVTDIYYRGDVQGLDVHSDFKHLTQVAAAYASYTYHNGPLSARAGLRYEFSHLSAKYLDGSNPNYKTDLHDWVPSASVNYQFNQFNSLKLAFSTTINRPGISFLNPARTENPTSISFGNSHLKSARNYSLNASFMHIGQKFTFNITPSFDMTNNKIETVNYVENGKTVDTYDNNLKKRWIGCSFFAQWNASINTSFMVNFNVGYDYYKNDVLNMSNDGVWYYPYAQFTQILPGKIRLNVSAGGSGGGPEEIYAKRNFETWYFFSLQRSFLKENRLTVQIAAQNIFSDKFKGSTVRQIKGDYTGVSTTSYVTRQFDITVSYRFGSLKSRVKKTNTTIENNDMIGGIKAGGDQGGQQQQGK